MSRLYAIPDIHGRVDLLTDLMFKIPKAAEDKIIFLGDYVDRGPDAYGVIAYLRQLQEDRPKQVVCLAGNHEWLMIDALTQGPHSSAWMLWMINGGHTTLNSYIGHESLMDEHVRWLSLLPLSHEEPGFFFSHAPIEKDAPLPYEREQLTWGHWDLHEEGHSEKHHEGRVGVCGHIHRLREGITKPRFYEHYLYLDCGCGCLPGAPLVAVDVKTRACYEVH